MSRLIVKNGVIVKEDTGEPAFKQASAAAAPSVVVPREPTPEMCAAGFCVSEAEHDPAGVYRAMLSAAPSQPDHAGLIEALAELDHDQLIREAAALLSRIRAELGKAQSVARRTFNDGLEAAAKLAEGTTYELGGQCCNDTCRQIAETVRAMKEPSASTDEGRKG